ncbi:hypothetical protein UlMin_039416 [Ulmus minor]
MVKPICDDHEFFKVFLPEDSSKQMCIPQAFVRGFIRTNPDNATIRDPTGKSWQVNVVKVDEDLFFGAGWEVFVSENSLRLGDFLLFNYDGTSLFHVKIFLRNGCRKGVVATPQTLPKVKIKEEDEGEENEEMRPSHKVDQSGEENGHKRKKLATPNHERVSEAAEYDAPKNPHFLVDLSKSKCYLYSVYVPRTLLDAHNIKLKPNILLIDENGKKWPATVTFRADSRICITSWTIFREKNNVTPKDKCVFEFILGRGNACKEMKVHVIRRAQKT